MKYILALLLLISASCYAQVDSVKYWKKLARDRKKFLDEVLYKALAATEDANRWHYLLLANEISTRSWELNNMNVAALLAVQAYNFNTKHKGYDYNNNIFGGLTSALRRYDSLPKKLSSHPSVRLSTTNIDSVRKGKALIVGDESGDIMIITDGIVRRKLSGHHAQIDHIEFSPTGRFLLTVSKDKILCIWNWADLTKHPLVIVESSLVEGVAFSSDESQLIVKVKEQNTPIHIWPLEQQKLANSLCSCLKRNMTKEEWQQYVGEIFAIPYEATCSRYPKNDK